MYDDEYATCRETYATFRVYPPGLDLEAISGRLAMRPTRVTVQTSSGADRGLTAWFLSTRGLVASRDLRRHLDWILGRLLMAQQAVLEMQAEGMRMDIFCFWDSATGHGGPVISAEQAGALSALHLDCVLDVYFSRCEEATP